MKIYKFLLTSVLIDFICQAWTRHCNFLLALSSRTENTGKMKHFTKNWWGHHSRWIKIKTVQIFKCVQTVPVRFLCLGRARFNVPPNTLWVIIRDGSLQVE